MYNPQLCILYMDVLIQETSVIILLSYNSKIYKLLMHIQFMVSTVLPREVHRLKTRVPKTKQKIYEVAEYGVFPQIFTYWLRMQSKKLNFATSKTIREAFNCVKGKTTTKHNYNIITRGLLPFIFRDLKSKIIICNKSGFIFLCFFLYFPRRSIHFCMRLNLV